MAEAISSVLDVFDHLVSWDWDDEKTCTMDQRLELMLQWMLYEKDEVTSMKMIG